MKPKLLLLPIVLFALSQSFGQTNLPSVLACNEILTTSGNPYIVDSTITIKPGCTLTVNPGVEIRMAENTHLIVQGKVDFLGTASQPILIHAKDTIWGNILLDSTLLVKSTFNYVNIENGRQNVDITKMKAVIFAYFSSFELKNCTFKNNLRCIYSYRSKNILIKNCVLDSTNIGEKILNQYADQVTIDNCTLYYTSGDADVIDFDGSTNVIISNNLLFGGGDDAIDLGHAIDPNHPDSLGCSNVTVTGNVIYNMFNKGVSNGENAANINIHHNLIVNCGWGIGAKAGAQVIADHNTIYNCQNGVKAYDHYDGWGPGHLTVTNCIIVGSDTTWFKDTTATLSISYSLSDSILISGTGNIQGDPLLVSTSLIPRWDSLLHLFTSPSIIASSDFHLQFNSPAIDAGDPAFALDPDGSRTDIGRYYLGQNTSVQQLDQNSGFELIYPNPGNGNFTIRLIPDYKMNRFVVLNNSGKVVQQNDFFGSRPAYQIDLSSQAAGVYYIKLYGGNGISTQKVIVH